MRGAKAVAIQINSPGGSAVQSVLIFRRIRALAEEKNLKVYVFAEDVAASGGYLLALAGDEIYADASSIIGSIGVVTATFGLNELINKIGIERRVYTAGRNKTTLDPFLPVKEDDVERVKAIQRDVHAEFIDLVKSRRGSRIEKAQEETFMGAGSATAFLVKNGHRFFLFNEKGSLIIAKLSPTGYDEIDKAHLLEPTGTAFGRKVVWSHPAFAEKCIFARNDKELVCFSLAKE